MDRLGAVKKITMTCYPSVKTRREKKKRTQVFLHFIQHAQCFQSFLNHASLAPVRMCAGRTAGRAEESSLKEKCVELKSGYVEVTKLLTYG